MDKTIALKAVLLMSVAGMLFSGYLSYGELLRDSCPLGGCSSLLGVPTCVYGFVMYAIIFLICLLGLASKK